MIIPTPLNPSKKTFIEDTILGQIEITAFEKEVIYSTEFNRLHDIYQNSTVYMTFPTNRTKRFEHSIGAMVISGEFFNSAVSNTGSELLDDLYEVADKVLNIASKMSLGKIMGEFYGSKHSREIRSFSQLREATFRGAEDPTGVCDLIYDYSEYIPSKVEPGYRLHHLILVQAIRMTGLLHDIGHPPFSHIIEHALNKAVNEEFKNCEGNLNNSKNTLPAYLKDLIKSPRALHEQIGLEIAEALLSELTREGHEPLEVRILIAIMTLGILSDGEFFTKNFSKSKESNIVVSFCRDLHRIVDSGLDADRLDYITRDAVSTGGSSRVDNKRLFGNVRICYGPEIDAAVHSFLFCFSIKVVGSIENVLYSRYDGYALVVYHHHCMKTNFLLDRIVRGLIAHWELDYNPGEPLEDIDIRISDDISGLWVPLNKDLNMIRRKFKLCQWTDSWLQIMLKKVYIEMVNNNSSQLYPYSNLLVSCLTEFVTNEKHVYTLIKRREDYKIIDDAVIFAIVKDRGIKDVLNRKCLREETEVSAFIRSVFRRKHDAVFDGFFTLQLRDILRDSFGYSGEYEEYLCFPKKIPIEFPEVYVEINTLNSGYDTKNPIWIYDTVGNIGPFTDYSSVPNSLEREIQGLPWFYLFSLTDPNSERTKLLHDVGVFLGGIIRNLVFDILSKP